MVNTISEILQQQRSFFRSQRTKEITYRKKALQKLEKIVLAQEDAICEAMYLDFKKPKFESLVSETQVVLAELRNSIKKLEFWAKPQKVTASWANFPSTDWVYYEPYGTVLIIAPWNYPFQLAMLPLIGAITAGNTIVLKPSELTPNTSKIVHDIIVTILEKAHVTVVEGGVEISQKLLREKWDYIFFTGSSRVGQIVYESAAKTLTPVTLELGGKNPCIVDETAALSLAAKRIVWGKCLNGGQTCVAPDYILVHKDVKGKLVSELIKYIKFFFGSITETSADLARMVNAQHYQSLMHLLEGEEILFGGDGNATDNFISPTLVNEPTLDSKLMQEEIFGPILPIISYQSEADLDQYLFHFEKPLAAYIFSNSKKNQTKILSRYSFGGGAINDTVVQYVSKHLPFGGVGKSGLGAYHGKTSFITFSHKKSIVKKSRWLDIPLRYPPYKLSEVITKNIKKLF